MTILELREKRNKAWEAAKAFLESHRTEKGTLTAEDDATYTQMEQEINDLGKEIARLERQEALEAELNRPVNQPLTNKPGSGRGEEPRPDVLPMNTGKPCWMRSAPTLNGCPTSCRKAWTQMAGIWYRKSMITG